MGVAGFMRTRAEPEFEHDKSHQMRNARCEMRNAPSFERSYSSVTSTTRLVPRAKQGVPSTDDPILLLRGCLYTDGHHEIYETVDASSRMYQAVTKVRILIENMSSAAKFEVVLVFSFFELLVTRSKYGLEYNLGGSSAEIEDCVGRGILRGAGLDSIEEIVGRDSLCRP